MSDPVLSTLENHAERDFPEPLLEVRDLSVRFGSGPEGVTAVDGVSFDVYPGETLGIVGESGSGKSVSMMSLLGLIPDRDRNPISGSAHFDGRDLLKLSPKELRSVRGNDIAMIFQDAMTALNPVLTVGFQLAESLRIHRSISKAKTGEQAVALLESVGVPNAETRVRQYPHEFSGGMRQRAMIAMAIANRPRLLIADEPTTALDVTIQAQVLDVLRHAKSEAGAATILITHDLGVVAEMADRVAVMYGGQIVEMGEVHQIFEEPSHPYTIGLLNSLPRLDTGSRPLEPIRGNPPSPGAFPPGCRFAPRCDLSRGRELCITVTPELIEVDGVRSRCHFVDEMAEFRESRALPKT